MTNNKEEKGKEIAVAETKEMFPLPTAEEVKKYLCPLATPAEIWFFLNTAKSLTLNPFKREIYLVKYSSSQPASIVVGYQSYLARASRSPFYRGFKCWVEQTSGDTEAICEVYRTDWMEQNDGEPFIWRVSFKEYNRNQALWKSHPKTMLKKVCIAQALRMAFPDECGGLPGTDMNILNGEVDVPPEEAKRSEVPKKLRVEQPKDKKEYEKTPIDPEFF